MRESEKGFELTAGEDRLPRQIVSDWDTLLIGVIASGRVNSEAGNYRHIVYLISKDNILFLSR